MAAPRKVRESANPRSGRSPVRTIKAAERSLIEIVTSEEDADEIPVFSIDGEVYTMPASIPAGIALQAIDVLRESGEMAAGVWMITQVVGEGAYEALKTSPAVTVQNLKDILDRVNDHVMGQMEDSGK